MVLGRFRESDVSGTSEVVMNCQKCNAKIDYRFLTTCAHCDGEVEPAALQTTNIGPDLLWAGPVERSLTWKQHLINLAYVFASSIAGMVSGAVVVYFSAALVYLAFFSSGPHGNSSEDCARGMAVGLLSILSGAYLGTVGGSVFAVKNPLCKSAGK